MRSVVRGRVHGLIPRPRTWDIPRNTARSQYLQQGVEGCPRALRTVVRRLRRRSLRTMSAQARDSQHVDSIGRLASVQPDRLCTPARLTPPGRHRYLTGHLDQLHYDTAPEAGWPIATGAIEGTRRRLIALLAQLLSGEFAAQSTGFSVDAMPCSPAHFAAPPMPRGRDWLASASGESSNSCKPPQLLGFRCDLSVWCQRS